MLTSQAYLVLFERVAKVLFDLQRMFLQAWQQNLPQQQLSVSCRIVSWKNYKYKDLKTHLDCRQQTGYARNEWLNKRNRDGNCTTCFVENFQDCASCANYCVEYTRLPNAGCVFWTILSVKQKTRSRASTLIFLTKSFIPPAILSPGPLPPHAMASISCIVLNGQRKEKVRQGPI
jgi:hypothetical protein